MNNDSRVVVFPFVEDNANELREYFTESVGGSGNLDNIGSYVLSQPGHGHQVIMSVAPAQGLYTGAELQDFMDSLVPELKPSGINRFNQDIKHSHENFLSVGSKNFREVYGKEQVAIKRVCQLNDNVFANDFNFKDRKKTVEEEKTIAYQRLIQVKVFPNEEIGRNALQRYQDSLKDESKSRDLYSILYVSLEEIQKYEPNIVEKLKARGQERFI